MTTFRNLVDDLMFALSGKPTERHRRRLKSQALAGDRDRAMGVMSSLGRPNALLSQERIHIPLKDAGMR